MDKLLYLIAAIIIAILSYRILKRIFLIMKIKSAAKSVGAQSIRCRYFPRIFCFKGKYDVTYDLAGKHHNIVLLMVQDRRARYFFKNENVIERYVATMFFAKGTRNYSRRAEWNEKSSIKLPWYNLSESNVNILVLSRFPTEVADTNSRTATLGNGDIMHGKIVLYDAKHFVEQIKNTDRYRSVFFICSNTDR